MSAENVSRLLAILALNQDITHLDITGGAPELHPKFEYLVISARAARHHVIGRHNLTVQMDGHPITGDALSHLPEFFARQRVEVISSLPCLLEENADRQRGKGVFWKSIQALKRLNDVGFGHEGSGLLLTLVYNPIGASLPPSQTTHEADYRRELWERHQIVFNRLHPITNMPINRFALHLKRENGYEAYLNRLEAAFNPQAAAAVMCRSLINVDHDGRLFDYDFNQQLGLEGSGIDG